MNRYHLEIDGRSFVIDVQELDADRFTVSVDGRDFDVSLAGREEIAAAGVSPVEPGLAPTGLPRGGPVVRPAAAPPAGLAVPVAVLPTLPVPPRAAPTAGPAAIAAAAPAADGPASLVAPMPGVILRVLVAPGASVRRGQDLAVLEAMKMENIIRAPYDAAVVDVCVRPGQHVGHGETLVRLQGGGS